MTVLLICLPLLEPLRHPAAGHMDDEEMARWATVQALVEQQTFAVDGTMFAHTRQLVRVGTATHYANQPPARRGCCWPGRTGCSTTGSGCGSPTTRGWSSTC